MAWPRKGLDVWRISLYPGAEGTRRMDNVTWKDNQEDCELVIKEMAKLYKTLFVIGHSLGGTNAVYVNNAALSGKVLWDPACNEGEEGAEAVSLHPDYYTLYWDHLVLVPKGYTAEAITATHYPGPLPKQPPVLVILSSEENYSWPKAKIPAKVVTIANSDHYFMNEGNEKKLFSKTLNFLNAHMPVVGQAGL
jgi:dienelactone hydrolase